MTTTTTIAYNPSSSCLGNCSCKCLKMRMSYSFIYFGDFVACTRSSLKQGAMLHCLFFSDFCLSNDEKQDAVVWKLELR